MNKEATILGMALNHATPEPLAGIHAARSHEAVMEADHHGKGVLVP